jgi:hypothetical protein
MRIPEEVDTKLKQQGKGVRHEGEVSGFLDGRVPQN